MYSQSVIQLSVVLVLQFNLGNRPKSVIISGKDIDSQVKDKTATSSTTGNAKLMTDTSGAQGCLGGAAVSCSRMMSGALL